ncbi:MAG: hypothetical protein JSU87_03750 [Gemmatimonadota bacterium]|nr:MAG: hypothetical protein JSU87_03750 [Gemmatimonadota bacterium]
MRDVVIGAVLAKIRLRDQVLRETSQGRVFSDSLDSKPGAALNAASARVRAGAVAIAVLALAQPAPCQQAATDSLIRESAPNAWGQPRFAIAAGSYFPVHSTGARLISVRTGQGTDVTFESDLGLPEFTFEFRIEADLRLGRRHHIAASAYSLNRQATKRLGREILWGEDTLFVGLTIDSFWNIKTLDISYQFLVLDRQAWNFGLNAGFYVAGFSSGLEAREVDLGAIQKYTMPLPLFGVNLAFRPSRRIELRGKAQYFYLSVDEFRGRIAELGALGAYRLSPRFFIGLGFNLFEIMVEDIETIQIGRNFQPQVGWKAEYRYGGPGILVGLTF